MDAANSFLGIMLRYENLLTMVGCWVFISTLTKVFKTSAKSKLVAKLLPLAPIIFCEGAVWLPGLQPAEAGIGERLMLGLVLGFGSGHIFKIWRQSVFGKDTRINGQQP